MLLGKIDRSEKNQRIPCDDAGCGRAKRPGRPCPGAIHLARCSDSRMYARCSSARSTDRKKTNEFPVTTLAAVEQRDQGARVQEQFTWHAAATPGCTRDAPRQDRQIGKKPTNSL